MTTFKLPLAGNVLQNIWTSFLNPFNNQVGLVNINLGKSSSPEVEEQILAEVGSYGKQLGRMGDALAVLVKHFRPEKPLTEKERDAIVALRLMLDEIADIKQSHRRPVVRP